jgi:hypothetical protein
MYGAQSTQALGRHDVKSNFRKAMQDVPEEHEVLQRIPQAWGATQLASAI